MFRIVFNWRRQCPILAHSARCNSLIRRWPRGRLQLPKLDAEIEWTGGSSLVSAADSLQPAERLNISRRSRCSLLFLTRFGRPLQRSLRVFLSKRTR